MGLNIKQFFDKDPRRDMDTKMEVSRIGHDDRKMHRVMGGTGKYVGSRREMDDRAGRNLPENRSRG